MPHTALAHYLRADADLWRRQVEQVKAQAFPREYNLLLGRDLEDLCSDFVRNRCHVATRQGSLIRTPDGQHSREVDVALLAEDSCQCGFPPNLPSPIPRGRLIQRDHCWGGLEIKSNLRLSDLVGDGGKKLGDLDKIAVLKGLPPRELEAKPELVPLVGDPCGKYFGAIIAHRASIPIAKIKSTLDSWCDSHPPRFWPSMVAIMGEGVFLCMDDTAGIVLCQDGDPSEAHRFRFYPVLTEYDIFAALFFAIDQHLEHAHRTHIPLYYALNGSRLSISRPPCGFGTAEEGAGRSCGDDRCTLRCRLAAPISGE